MKDRGIKAEREAVIINGVSHVVPTEVAYRDFAKLVDRRGWTKETLAELFRGKIEEPMDFFQRVLSCKYQGEDRSNVIIPFRSVLDLFFKELSFQQDKEGREKFCACGCGTRVWERKKWSSLACRKRFQRRESQTVIFASVSG